MPLDTAGQRLAMDQSGVLSRRQLLGHGVTPSELRWRVGRTWRLLLPGVVLLRPDLPSDDQRLMAALLYAGAGSWLAGTTAAALHGVPGCTVRSPVDVLVPAPRRPRTVAWVSVRSTTLTTERIVPRGSLRLSCVARSVVDAAAAAPTDDAARGIVIGAMQRRLVRLDDLAHWVHARESRGRRRLTALLAESGEGVWSVPEADLLRLVRRSSILSEPWANPLLHAGARRPTTPDAWFDDVGMAVMVHSRRYHAGELEWEATVEGDGDLVEAGVVVVGITPRSINRRPAAELTRIERAWASAAARPRPDVTATRRETWAPHSAWSPSLRG